MTYLIEQEHTKEECLKALDQMNESPKMLENCYFGCSAGQHEGFCFVDASSESEVQNMLPTGFLSHARIMQVEKFSPEQIRSFHQSGSGSQYGKESGSTSQYGSQSSTRGTSSEYGTESRRGYTTGSESEYETEDRSRSEK